MQLAPQERPVPSAPRVSQENQEQRVCGDCLDQWVNKDLRDLLDRKDHLDLLDRLVCLVCVETLVLKERKDTQVLLGLSDPLESRERKETEVFLALRDPLDPKEKMECLEELDRWALLGLLVCLVLKVSKVQRERVEELVQREKRVCKDLLDLQAPQARSFSLCQSRGVPSRNAPSMPVSCCPSLTATCRHLTPPVPSS